MKAPLRVRGLFLVPSMFFSFELSSLNLSNRLQTPLQRAQHRGAISPCLSPGLSAPSQTATSHCPPNVRLQMCIPGLRDKTRTGGKHRTA
ncbi:hypothetical protein ATANTOWER_020308 [Ataeniobius toweri]|uniref:Secreted protein n=1 Tax=Ataeniobius toweri TaxID=208326 RepID=A0ABU7ASH7_9TELE|nr:hypothetical protein [Ataeniobius toweri]